AGHFGSWRGLHVSSIGLGTYHGPEDGATDEAYEQAVVQAMEAGLNVVDAAINYRHQRSERSIGSALRSLIGAGAVRRDEVLVATKAGFIPFDGEAPEDVAGYVADTYVRPGIVAARDIVGGCHCVTPRYLANQLD